MRNFDLPIEHVDNINPSFKVYLQKIGPKKQVEHVEEVQKLGSKVDLQKVKVEHVEKGSTSNIQVQIINQIYN